MRVAFVDHAYHQKTGSTEFFKDAFLSDHDVDEWWDDRWHGGAALDVAAVLDQDYDLVVVWQAQEAAVEIAATVGARNVLYVPMWDGAAELPESYWKQFGGVRILAFCYALYERVRDLGLSATYAQYFPDVDEFAEITDFTTLRGFFWPRRPEVTWKQVAELVGAATFNRFHLHFAPDPESGPVLPPLEEQLPFPVTGSQWFPTRADFYRQLEHANVFFAPRLLEGIGISFLEAMAMGMCVCAPDNPTMNEYITNRVNGLLWNPSNLRALDYSAAADLGRRARAAMADGRERWLTDLPRLSEFILTPTETRSLTTHSMKQHATSDAVGERRVARVRWFAKFFSLLQAKRTAYLLRRSGLFFSTWYLDRNPDVRLEGIDPVWHYVRYGAAEGRDPSPFFDTRFYLTRYQDVARSGENPLLHYIRRGLTEGRAANSWFDPVLHLSTAERSGTVADLVAWFATASPDEISRQWPHSRRDH